jgi:TIGR03009 family protein
LEDDLVFKKKILDEGALKYSTPDKGLFRVDGNRSLLWTWDPLKNDWSGPARIPSDRSEQWISDGKSIFEYKYTDKKMIEHRLPPERQGKAIADGPLPFVFNTEAERLKQRYFMRITTPSDARGEVWLEAYPRFQQDAADFKKVELILKTDRMLPFAIQLFSPNGKDRTVYQFDRVVVNRPLRWIIDNDWFHASVPLGWKKIVEEPAPPIQAHRVSMGIQQ